MWSIEIASSGAITISFTESVPAISDYLRSSLWIVPVGAAPLPVWQPRIDLTIAPRASIFYHDEVTNAPYILAVDSVNYRQPTELRTIAVTAAGRASLNVQSAGINSAPEFVSFATAVRHNTLAATRQSASGNITESISQTRQFLSPLAAGDSHSVGFQGDAPEAPWQLSFDHVVNAPTYAAPSTTVPQCRSLDCMDFADGKYQHLSYEIVLDVAVSEIRVVMTPVPELPAWAALIAGLTLMGAVISRRRPGDTQPWPA
ncbi:MAG: hypothetical protein ACKVQQ_15145 [Burkholderiales bacterium]